MEDGKQRTAGVEQGDLKVSMSRGQETMLLSLAQVWAFLQS